MLPKLGYMSLLDGYLLLAFLLTMASGIETMVLYWAVAGVMDQDEDATASSSWSAQGSLTYEEGRTIDITFMSLELVIWIVYNVIVVLRARSSLFGSRHNRLFRDDTNHPINQKYQTWAAHWDNLSQCSEQMRREQRLRERNRQVELRTTNRTVV
jgi:hypothetical protein